MSQPTHIFVTASEGRSVPIPPNEASAPGAALLICKPGKVYRLPYTTHTRRRINSGDLIMTNRGGTKVEDLELAASAEAVDLDQDGAVDVSYPRGAKSDTVPLGPNVAAFDEVNVEGSTAPKFTTEGSLAPSGRADLKPRKG